jgi:hypothetical protein
MLQLKSLSQSLSISEPENSSISQIGLGLSLITTILYALLALRPGFQAEFVVQDDARQHIFWMYRWLDSTLFPNDWIAHYFESVAPKGYASLYRGVAALGIDPFQFNKVLPMGLALVTAFYSYRACLKLLPVPIAAFLTTLFLNQTLWDRDDLISGTARAFVYPIFAAFLYYLLNSSLIPCLVTIVLSGLFYPQFTLVIMGILVLRCLDWQAGFRLRWHRQHLPLSLAGLGVAGLVLLPYLVERSEFAPAVTGAIALTMPEFQLGGRAEFFLANPMQFWLRAKRSGLLIRVMYPAIAATMAFPFLLWFKSKFPLLRSLRESEILLQLAVVSVALFTAAHLMLFKLYLPGRYTQISLQFITSILGGMAIAVILDRVLNQGILQRYRQISIIAAMLVLCLLPFAQRNFPNDSYIVGKVPGIYQFLRQQPKDSLIASLSQEADNIPSFAQRSVFASQEYALPYHLGYYQPMRDRIAALMQVSYSADLATVQAFTQRYGIDFWLVDRSQLNRSPLSPSEDLKQQGFQSWLQQFPDLAQAIDQQLRQGQVPALLRLIPQCSTITEENLAILPSACVLKAR